MSDYRSRRRGIPAYQADLLGSFGRDQEELWLHFVGLLIAKDGYEKGVTGTEREADDLLKAFNERFRNG